MRTARIAYTLARSSRVEPGRTPGVLIDETEQPDPANEGFDDSETQLLFPGR